MNQIIYNLPSLLGIVIHRLILSFLFSFLVFFLIAQPKEIVLDNGELLSTNEGLNGRIITCMYEDSEGFIWVGTSMGVNRYDGHRFWPFSNLFVSYILEDKNKYIWLAPKSRFGEYLSSEIEILNPRTTDKRKVKDVFPESDFLNQNVLGFEQDAQHNLWFSTANGEIYKCNGIDLQLIYKNESGNPIRKVIPIGEFELILIENNTLKRWSKTEGIIEQEEIPDGVNKVWLGKNDRIWLKKYFPFKSLNKDSKKTVIQSTELCYKDKGKKIEQFHFQDGFDEINHGNFLLNQMGDGNIWCHKKDHYRRYDSSGKLLTKFILPLKEQERIGGANNENIYFGSKNIYGKDGTLWIASKLGILKFSDKSSNFKNILGEYAGELLSTRGIIDIDKDSLLICVYGVGLVKLDLNKLNEYDSTRLKNSPYTFVGVAKDRNGDIWIGTHGPLIHRYISNEQVEGGYSLDTFRYDILTQFQNPYYDFVNGQLWIGSIRNGLFYFDYEKNEILPFLKLNEYEQFKDARITCFFQNDKKLWIGTDEGVYILDPDNGIVAWHNDFYIKEIMGIHHADDGYIWLAGNGGLVRWDPSNNKQKYFSEKNGFPDDYLYAVYPDEFGFLWLPSNKGLIRFNTTSFEINAFLPSSGIAHEEFNRYSHFKDDRGRFYFGGLNGVTVFNPSDFLETKVKPAQVKLIELNFVKNNSGDLINQLPDFFKTNQVDWMPFMKSFQIRFALQDYSLANKQSYAYMVEGLDNEWIYINDNTLRFNQLPYGDYILKIKGIGGKGLWSSPMSIPLNVIQPFYQSWWFIGLICLTLLGLLFSLFQWRVGSLEKEVAKRTQQIENDRQLIQNQYEELELLNKAKDRFYTIIAHDLRDPVTSFKGIAGKINYLIKRNEPKRVFQLAEHVEESADNLSKLLENLLSWAEQQRGELLFRPSKHKFGSLVKEVFKILEIFATTKGIKLEYKGSPEAEIFGDFHMLGTVLRNLVHNAIKFSQPNGHVIVDCKHVNGNTVFTVSDSGIGIQKPDLKKLFKIKTIPTALGTLGEKGTGLGLVLCHDLVRKHQGEISVKSEKGEYAIFTVSIPFTEN